MLKSRFPAIAAELDRSPVERWRRAQKLVSDGAKGRVAVGESAPHIRDAIHTDSQPEGVYVVAGDSQTFYGHILEHGTSRWPPDRSLSRRWRRTRSGSGTRRRGTEARMSTAVRGDVRQARRRHDAQQPPRDPATGYSKAIYHAQAPDNATFPFVVFNKQSGVPTEAFGAPSVMENDIWLVKGDRSGHQRRHRREHPSPDRVLLNDASLSISGGTLLYLRRQSDVEYPEVDEGVQYHHAGRCTASSTRSKPPRSIQGCRSRGQPIHRPVPQGGVIEGDHRG
jgi:hypothetical protein